MKITVHQNANFSASVELNEEVIREDAIERVVSEFTKFLKQNAKDGQRINVSASTRTVENGDDWD